LPSGGDERLVGHRNLNRRSIAPEEQDVNGAASATGGDWLDACCWRCGTDEALLDTGGRLLCPLCRAELSEAPPDASDDPLRLGQSAYWESHAMERCWRCLTGSVDPEEEIGLCRACRADLSASSASRRHGG
jgi:predicted amidophosphoribosyltransferase